MAEKKGVGHAYNVDFLNVVFAASSLFLFLSVIWMVWDDYDRDWKNTQRRFAQLEYEVTQAQLQQASARRRSQTKLQQLQAQRQAAREKVAANQQKVDELQEQARGRRQPAVPRHDRLPDGEGDVRPGPLRLRGVAERRASPSAEAKGQAVAEQERRVTELNLEVEKITAERTALQTELGEVHRPGRDHREADRRDDRRGDPAAEAARRDRAERREGLLPQRAAARLHGADAQDSADHPARTSSTT